MKMITNKGTDADARHPGRRPEGHRPGRGGAGLRAPFDGHVVRRTMVTLQHRVLTTTETGRELAHGHRSFSSAGGSGVTAGACVLKSSSATGAWWADAWPLAVKVLMPIIVDNTHRRRYRDAVLMQIAFI
jgi:hypothetical protein